MALSVRDIPNNGAVLSAERKQQLIDDNAASLKVGLVLSDLVWVGLGDAI